MRILILSTVRFRQNGITTVIMNYFRHMNKSEMEFSFAIMDTISQEYRDELLRAGVEVHMLPHKKSVYAYMSELKRIIKAGKYDAVNIHGNSGTMAIEVVLAKLCGVKKILIHAHSTRTDHPAVNAILKYPMMWFSQECIACSEAAGKWLYGKHPYILLNNAIDLERFRFDPVVRDACRSEFGIGGEFVMGHIGNFYEPKNHPFLIEIFAAFHKRNPNSKLLLAGGGPDVAAAEEKAKALHLQNAVIFAGKRTDPERIYQALDVFVMPSLWEGLPLVLLEAQASGLPVLASDRITKEVRCAENFRYLPLEEGVEIWVEHLLALSREKAERTLATTEGLRQRGFDIRAEAQRLRNLYLNGIV